jgi:hypothetical protein
MRRKSRNVPSLHEGRPAALLLLGRRLRVRRWVALLRVPLRRVALPRRRVAGRRVAVLPRVALLRRDADGGLLAVVAHLPLLLPCDRRGGRGAGRVRGAFAGSVCVGVWARATGEE